MRIYEREPGDLERLEELVGAERDAKQRDRYRIALLAPRGWEAEQIAGAMCSNRRTVQAWAYRYRDGGIAALTPGKAPGNKPLLPSARHEEFRNRIINGPREGDGVCTLRAKDAQRILREEFGVVYKLAGVYDLMHRLGLACLKPRPRHEDSDPEAMRKFAEESAPFLSAR
ncbi:MAG: winged helix-turn-helix domain-containing protein [Phycisphaerales bacterium]|nr:winged helix-turn-helix domain-containing protein [Phycisphaerales bacterium]